MTAGETPIRDPAELGERVASWPACAPLALDTEFVRERTYYPQLCLIQVAVQGAVTLVDAMVIADGGALVPPLADPGRLKIVHAARQDIESLLPLTGVPPAPVFDTQQAAALLGFPAQVGYAELARQLLGVELSKGHARTDWARRPLTPEQLAYAADDVRFLHDLADALEARLLAAGRRSWLDEESALLRDISLYRVEPADAWKKLKGLERLDDEAFAAACALAAWRERRAMERDLPRGWVLPDAAIHELAQCRPRTRHELSRIATVPRGTVARAADEMLAAIARPGQETAGRAASDSGRPGPDELRRLKLLQNRLSGIAVELGIRPEVLATRRELAALARGARKLPVLTGWRKDVVGEPLLAAL